ncbi:PREDICTED: uncharacterized protein LOC108611854 [Drosophila arizonae]|uniref:Uncharacterized protein LOC108611854 n=1 Tax=Drosophila arizonae TaxID=7263 RepID=A0ABM1NYX7_DROAR|nr:PREDICTED: uncharacterized protein LOC108611854 [Drosophila arizonae]
MKIYKQKLREVWLQMPEFRQWLRRDPEDSYRARCRFCKCGVNTKICDLRAHALTKKHKKMHPTTDANRNDSSNDEDSSFDHHMDYKPRKATEPKRLKAHTHDNKSNIKLSPVKTEKSASNGPDYEAIIESLALYEPEQVLFSNGSTPQSDDQVENPAPIANIDEESITNAVTVAVKNLKDSSQIFGDFVADRLRQLSFATSENTKDKIMQVLLEAAALERTTNGN